MELNISDYRKRYSEYTIEEFCKINESVPQNFKYLLVLDFKVTCGNEEFELIREEDAVVLGIFITVYFFFNFAGIFNYLTMKIRYLLLFIPTNFDLFQTIVMKKKSLNLLAL